MSVIERSLWVRDSDGRVCCSAHIGYYGTAALAVDSDSAYLSTPLGEWVRMSFLDAQEWERFALSLRSDACEGCC